MKKRLLSILLAICLLAGLLPTVALAANSVTNVTYYDWNSSTNQLEEKSCSSATLVESSTDKVTWSNGWYVAQGNVTISGGVTISGDVFLILADGCTLTIDASIQGEGNLTIYGQSGGTGQLIVNGNNSANAYSSCSIKVNSLTINGGSITATGGSVINEDGVETGGSYGIYASSISISGGHVTAKAPKGFALSAEPTLPATYWWRINAEKPLTETVDEETKYSHDGYTYVEIWYTAPTYTYTVALDRNDGGSEVTPLTTGADGKLASLPTPSLDGYTFAGWFTAAEGGTQVTTETVFTADATIYAHWTRKTYSVTVTDGTAEPSGNQAAGTEITITADTKPGYTFKEWTGLDDSAYKSGSSKTSNPATFAMPASAVTVAATYDPAALTGTVTISGTTKFGGVLTATVKDSNNTGTLSYQWKRGSSNIGTNSQTYTLVEDDIGSTITVTLTSDIQTGAITSAATSAITKADGPAAPSVTGVKPSVLGASDGKITGTTAAMENSTDSGFASSNPCSAGETTGLSAGTYYVRVKATATHEAGAYAAVTVPAGDAALTYSISLDVSGTHTFDPAVVGYGAQTSKTVTVRNTGTGATGTLSVALSGTNPDAFTVSPTSISSIAPGGTDSFTVVPNTGLPASTYTATVTVNEDSVDAKSFAVSFTVNAATEYTITFDGNGGTLSATSMTTTGQKLASLPDPPRNGYIFDGWFTAVTGGDRVTAATVFSGNTTIYAHWTAVFSGDSFSGGSSSGGGSSSSSGTTTKNPDGSTTTTTTDKTTGTVTETTKNTDGSTTTVETKKDGTVTETIKTADGTTGTVTTDKNGNVTQAKAVISSSAAKEAGKTGGAVTLPVEVPAVKATGDAPAVEITLSQNSGSLKVEIPMEKTTPGTVAVIVKADGTEEIVTTSKVTENGVALKLNGSTTVKVFDNAKSFTDVSANNVFYTEVCSLSAREIMVGKSDEKFDLYSNVTLNQISNVAGRITGAVDVKDYNGGIAWGQANGLKTGNESATRADMLKALYNAAGSPAVTDTSILAQFNDPISEDMKDISAWAAQNGILKGTVDGKANLGANVTRGQACALAGRTLKILG